MHSLVRTLVRTTLLAAAIAQFVACNSVSGQIDGENVSVQNAIMVQPDYDPGDYEFIYVILTAAPCADIKELYDIFLDLGEDEVPDLEAAEEAWADAYPEDWWKVGIVLTVEDVDDNLQGETIEGYDYDDDYQFDVDDFEPLAQGSLRHYKQWLDEDYFEGDYDDGTDYVESWTTHEGELKVTGHTPDKQLAGTFTTTAVEVEYDYETNEVDVDEEGDITIQFNAQRCEDLEDEEYLSFLGYF